MINFDENSLSLSKADKRIYFFIISTGILFLSIIFSLASRLLFDFYNYITLNRFSKMSLLDICIVLPFLIIFICLFYYHIFTTFRIIRFIINKHRIIQILNFKDENIKTGKILKVKNVTYLRKYSTFNHYYLIVEFCGEKIKSIPFTTNPYFANNNRYLYSEGDAILVVVYKRHEYVILKKINCI